MAPWKWGATTITRSMEIATVHAIAALARQEQSDIAAAARKLEAARIRIGEHVTVVNPEQDER